MQKCLRNAFGHNKLGKVGLLWKKSNKFEFCFLLTTLTGTKEGEAKLQEIASLNNVRLGSASVVPVYLTPQCKIQQCTGFVPQIDAVICAK